MGKLIDLTGKKFGRLTVIERVYSKSYTAWKCQCDCGNTTISDGWELRKGIIKSCGCYHKDTCGNDHRTHGLSKTRLYRIYHKMRERCYRPDNDNYKWYGALGVTVCKEWLDDFSKFAAWALSNGYSDELTIDRINPAGNYEPSNCRWATMKEQNNNRRKRGSIYGNNKQLNTAKESGTDSIPDKGCGKGTD